MKSQQETKITILSEILRFNKEERYDDKDDYAPRLASSYLESLIANGKEESFQKKSSKIRTNFFKYNRIKKSEYIEKIFDSLSKKKIKLSDLKDWPPLTFYDLFPEIKKIKDDEIDDINNKLNIKEEIIQNSLRIAFREKGGSPIARRGKDSALEVSDIEPFYLDVKNKRFSFSIVVKGYNSLKGSKKPSRKLNFEDVSHQISKAYNRNKPDFIILVTAREPVDGLLSELQSEGTSRGNPHLIIIVPPMDLIKFLHYRKII